MEKFNLSPTLVISEDDDDLGLAELLASDSPTKVQVQCTEDDDVDLDELLRKNDDVSADNNSIPLPSSSLSPRSSGRDRLFDQGHEQVSKNGLATEALLQSPSKSAAAVVVAGNESAPGSPPVSPSSPTKSPILAIEEDEDAEPTHWVMPAPAQPGDFLNNSTNRVPSKSILKKTSSYGNFSEASSSDTKRLGKKKPSFLNLSMGSVNSSRSENSGDGSSYGVGLDLGDSSSAQSPHRRLSLTKISTVDENSVQTMDNIPPMPLLTTSADYTDRGAVSASNSLDLSSSRNSKKMNRTVSFTSVDIREYDRTIGDNPSCRSGPPLSLDWSYSKKYEQPKCLDEFETERESERVKNLRKLHVNKYRRKNLLSFNWGHSEEEMKSARQETRKLQRQRSLTQALLPIHMAEEAYISVKGFIAKKRGKAECPKKELQKVTDELSKSTEDTSMNGGLRKVASWNRL